MLICVTKNTILLFLSVLIFFGNPSFGTSAAFIRYKYFLLLQMSIVVKLSGNYLGALLLLISA